LVKYKLKNQDQSTSSTGVSFGGYYGA